MKKINRMQKKKEAKKRKLENIKKNGVVKRKKPNLIVETD